MAEQAMIPVKFEGQQYDVPAELLAADQRDNTRLVQQYIQEEVAEAEFRVQKQKVKQEKAYEAEFTSIQKRLSAVESKDKIINNLQRENASLAAAVEAQAKQIEALESSGADAGSASAKARQVAYDLANASTAGHGTLSELVRANEQMQRQVTDMQAQLEEHAALFKKRADEAQAADVTRSRLEQEQTVRLIDDVARAEAVARKAEAAAATALRDAEAAQVVNANGSITKADITTAVTAELAAQAPEMVNQAIETIKRDEFQGGSMFGPRSDGDYVRRQRSDAINQQEGQA